MKRNTLKGVRNMKKYDYILKDRETGETVKRSNNMKTIYKEWKKYNFNKRGFKYTDRDGDLYFLDITGEYIPGDPAYLEWRLEA